MTARSQSSILGSPVLVGTLTALITVVAVFLSYNANTGLPFVPTYDITARVPDAAGLIRGNDVRVGGKRVGIIKSIDALPARSGRAEAELALALESRVDPVMDDTQVTVRPRSPLGLKYLELVPGTRGRPVPAGGALPAAAAQPIVELDEAIDAFDAGTRRALQATVDQLGTGLAGRGAGFNRLLEESPRLLGRVERVGANLSDRGTDLQGLLRGADRTLLELALASGHLAPLVEAGSLTAGALARSQAGLRETVAELPGTEAVARDALAAARPVLEDAAGLARDLRRGTPLLPGAAARLDTAIDTGVPVLRRATGLAGDLGATLAAVRRLSEDPLTLSTLERLLATVSSAKPTLEEIAPLQTVCNYIGLWTRNVVSTISEGDASGNWFRTLVVNQPAEQMAAAEPAPDLHVNPYPN